MSSNIDTANSTPGTLQDVDIESSDRNSNNNNNDGTTPMEDDQQQQDPASRSGLYKKLAVALLLVAFIVYVIVDSFTAGNVRTGIDDFLTWVEDNPIPNFFAFMVVSFVATILFVPGSILTLGSGFLFANAFGLGP